MRPSGGMVALMLMLTLSFDAPAAQSAKYVEPDDAATQAAARAALGSAKILDIVRTTLDIENITRGIESVLKELGAKVSAQEIRIELAADVLFDFDRYELRQEALSSLEKVAEVLRSHAKSPVMIEGHTDGKGSDAYNQPLSEKRAQAVREWLVKQGGASAARISVKGWGKAKPIVPNTRPDGSDDPEGRKKNRRVEITLRTAQGGR